MEPETDIIECNCPKVECVRYLKCEECTIYHSNKGGLPHCKREPKEAKTSQRKLLEM